MSDPASCDTPPPPAHHHSASIPANQHTHRPDLVLDLHPHQSVDVGLTREHLHRGAWVLDLIGVARLRDELHDMQDFAPAVHGQDAGNPGADLFEVFG